MLAVCSFMAIAFISCNKDPKPEPEPQEPENKSTTANSYIVSAAGEFKFPTVKGNSSISVGEVASVEVLWETFGTATAPSVGDLVKNVKYADGYISFDATDKKGNALIAAKDESGKILWSWHIWLTDKPADQVYYNNAGTMMDRNLGATSATPGDVEALGLMYQWGRKDPFLCSSSISGSIFAVSTLTSWPTPVASDVTNGTITYAQEHPTTFITKNDENGDWYFTGDKSTDDTRWQSQKTIYDPCPVGYRVPDGGKDGIWAKAFGSSSVQSQYDSTKEGQNFSGYLGDDSIIWYPLTGYIGVSNGALSGVGERGRYRSVSMEDSKSLSFDLYNSACYLWYDYSNAGGQSVRCYKE